jgi:hypothetical protein
MYFPNAWCSRDVKSIQIFRPKKTDQVINANGFLMVNLILFESRWSKNYTLFTTPSSVAVLLIFLKNSYRASTSLTLTAKQSQIQSFFTKTVTKWHKLNEALKYLNTKFVVSTFQQINYHL